VRERERGGRRAVGGGSGPEGSRSVEGNTPILPPDASGQPIYLDAFVTEFSSRASGSLHWIGCLWLVEEGKGGNRRALRLA